VYNCCIIFKIYSIYFIVSFSFLFLLFIGCVDTRLVRYSTAVNLFSAGGGVVIFKMIMSVAVGFLYMLNTIL
jgi:hypothetical protein